MIRQRAESDLTVRVWVPSGTTGIVRIRVGPHNFVFDSQDAVALAEQLVDALSQPKAEQ